MNRKLRIRVASPRPLLEYQTRKVLAKQQMGYTWLGPASREEYAVAQWFERHKVKYIFQQPYRGYRRRPLRVDFQVISHTVRPLVVEVMGDKWHGGREQLRRDRQRKLFIMRNATIKPRWVEVWGHAITDARGFRTPTYAVFDRVMRAALRGKQLSTESGFIG